MLQALRDEVIIEFEEEAKRGRVIIPQTANRFKIIEDHKKTALVLSVGPQCTLEIKEGANVYIMHNEGRRFYYQGKEYYTVTTKKPHDWVLAKYEPHRQD